MASVKKSENPGYKKLKTDIANGNIGSLYVFYGEEDYLKSHYLSRLEEICAGAFDAFNITKLEGDKLDFQSLREAVDGLPMGSDKKLVIVRDYKLMQPTGELREKLCDILSDLPKETCLVFYFDALEFKADKRLNIYKTLEKYGQIVEFAHVPSEDLIPWLKRRFNAFGKNISTEQCQYMLFICGASMTTLASEADKIASGVRGSTISKADIDALASRALEAQVFDLTDCIMNGRYDKAMLILRDLFDMRNEPVAVLAAVTRQMQRIYGAKLALENGYREDYVAKLFGFRSTYPAQLLMKAARRMDIQSLRKIQHMCLKTDMMIKSNLPDPQRTVELLLLQMGSMANAS